MIRYYLPFLLFIVSLCLAAEPLFYVHAQGGISPSDSNRTVSFADETNGQVLRDRPQPQPELQNFGINRQDVLDMIEIISLNRTENQNRTLYPVSHLNQTDIQGDRDWIIYDYVWNENPGHRDVEAVLGFKAAADGILFEVNKLTQLGVEIRIGNQTYLMPETRIGEISPGFLLTNVFLSMIEEQKIMPSPHPLHWLFH